MAIANALQLFRPLSSLVVSRDVMPSLKSMNLSVAGSAFATDALLYAMTLTVELEYLLCVACDVLKLYTKFECNRAIRGGVIAISIFDLMTYLPLCSAWNADAV